MISKSLFDIIISFSNSYSFYIIHVSTILYSATHSTIYENDFSLKNRLSVLNEISQHIPRIHVFVFRALRAIEGCTGPILCSMRSSVQRRVHSFGHILRRPDTHPTRVIHQFDSQSEKLETISRQTTLSFVGR